MTLKRTYIYMALAAMLGCLSMPLLSSCTSDNDMPGGVGLPSDPAVEEEESDYVWLSVDLDNTASPQSRPAQSRSDAPEHPQESGSYDENYIDCENGDFTLLLFDGNMLFMRNISKADYKITVDNSVSDRTKYKLQFRVPFEYLKSAYGVNSDFSLLFVANMKGVTSTYQPFVAIPFLTSYNEVSRQLQWFEYSTGGTKPWEPDQSNPNKKKLIPMSGIKKFSVNTSGLISSTPENPCDIGRIDMQRALVKLRFVDNVVGKETKRFVKMVSLTGLNMKGAFIPSCDNAPQWGLATSHVQKATASPDWYDEDRYTYRIEDKEEIYVDPDDNKEYPLKYYMYVAEYSDAIRPGDKKGSRIVIKLGHMKDPNNSMDLDYEIYLSDLGITDLVRNHIYEFNIEYDPIHPEKLTLRYNVCDWVVEPDINIDFN